MELYLLTRGAEPRGKLVCHRQLSSLLPTPPGAIQEGNHVINIKVHVNVKSISIIPPKYNPNIPCQIKLGLQNPRMG